MDISLARTFLVVAETGSFIDAARRLNLTQSTISARIKGLEDQLGRPLFSRSNSGAALTAAGEQFRRHALALVRVWHHAQLEVGLTDMHSNHLSVAAQSSLWDGFLIRWLGWMRREIPDISVSASIGQPDEIVQQMIQGTLDLALLYRPISPPGIVSEHLFDDELVLVLSTPAGRPRSEADYVYVSWGPDFHHDHAAAYPELNNTGLLLDVGTIGLDYLLSNAASGYFPWRLVSSHVKRGKLRLAPRARKFVYPVFMIYPEARDEEAYEPILHGIRHEASKLAKNTRPPTATTRSSKTR